MLLSIGQSTSFCAWATIEAGLRLSSSGQRLFGVYRIMWICSCASKWVVVVAVLALAKLSALCGKKAATRRSGQHLVYEKKPL